ncbi:hypothetical protein ILYODFUR_014708 [Ilyodon furcidens]|uniref:Uncharacterized protein n=1 Tax=Ilyodon furcidens TaxID=33524 RepID=A0ABV0UG54_9TELE
MGLLAASLIYDLLTRPVSTGRFAVVSYFFHFQMIYKAWDLVMFKLLYNFHSDLSPAFFGLHCAVCSLRFTNNPLRPSQNSCIYKEIKLYTGGLFLQFTKL